MTTLFDKIRTDPCKECGRFHYDYAKLGFPKWNEECGLMRHVEYKKKRGDIPHEGVAKRKKK